MTVYIASVVRRFRGAFGPKPAGDYATVGQQLDDEQPMSITNALTHRPPVEDNISYYEGTFESAADAYRAIRKAFPKAIIRG